MLRWHRHGTRGANGVLIIHGKIEGSDLEEADHWRAYRRICEYSDQKKPADLHMRFVQRSGYNPGNGEPYFILMKELVQLCNLNLFILRLV